MHMAVRKFVDSPAGQGFVYLRRRWNTWNDWRYNIDTSDHGELVRPQDWSDSKHGDGNRYQAPDYNNLFKLRRMLHLQEDDVFYDIGCGKGRVLCVIARKRLRKVIGVELVPQLCDRAEDNAEKMRGRQSPIEIRCGDACEADLSGGTVYYFYNTFGPRTMQEVLEKIRHEASPAKPARIVYYNALQEDLFSAVGWLRRYYAFKTYTGRVVSFWQSADAPPVGGPGLTTQ